MVRCELVFLVHAGRVTSGDIIWSAGSYLSVLLNHAKISDPLGTSNLYHLGVTGDLVAYQNSELVCVN